MSNVINKKLITHRNSEQVLKHSRLSDLCIISADKAYFLTLLNFEGWGPQYCTSLLLFTELDNNLDISPLVYSCV